jgi:hypothetical protein
MNSTEEALLPELTVIFPFTTNPCVVPLDDTLAPVFGIRLQSLTWRTAYNPPDNTLWMECASITCNRSLANGQPAPIFATIPIGPNLNTNEGHKTLAVWGNAIPKGTLRLTLKYMAVGNATPQLVVIDPNDAWVCTLLINPLKTIVELPNDWKTRPDENETLKRFRTE